MHGIHLGRVALGGAVAGIVMDVGEYTLHRIVLRSRWDAARQARGIEGYGPGDAAISAAMVFILGLVLVWTYAAMRPRFGADPRTALRAGFLVWVLGWLWPFLGNVVWDFLPTELFLIVIVWGFFEVMLASILGAWIYREVG
jgi:hypothetical protein